MRIVGLDLSLTSTGVAVVNVDSKTRHCSTERIKSKATADATLYDRQRRLERLKFEIAERAAGADLAVLEGPATASKSGHMHDRSGLWWLVVDLLRQPSLFDTEGLAVAEVPPSSLKKYATGNGSAGKDEVLAAVVRRFASVDVKGNDDADALVLAAMGARWLGSPIDEMPRKHLEAMIKVRWPERVQQVTA